ncbi:hypothetical protein [Pseudomonas aeruginosa]|uniref:hypothetical protein n=1 Tax=Pseudomonas aeruginosa TaxID=287 RepID=UPI0019147777|nr:hypothetical protein [Pseudomonas aeruginosa]
MTNANECTCPSGDGSLRHPCQAHPAPVELAGVAATLTFINGRPAMCGCQVEYSSGGGEYSDVIYVTLCAKHSGSAILDLVATNRIALTPEYEGQWHADLYLDREIPLAKAEGATPAEAVLALMSAERIDPEQESVEQAGGDERAAFEVWASPLGWKLSPDQNNCGIVVAERYGHPGVQRCWEAWQARAALAQPSPAQAEKAEVERTEGSADLLAIVREAVAGAYNEWKMISEAVTEIMEAHERIVGELRADRDLWAEQAEQRLADWDEMRKERDAALARVAEMEAKLSELEKQEPLLHINPLVVDELLGRAKRSPGGLTWSKGRCGSWTLPLYAAPVAQAQHSVPDVSGCRRNRSALTDAQMRRLYDNSTEAEKEHLGFAAFARLMRLAEAVHQIAAAPGKEGA